MRGHLRTTISKHCIRISRIIPWDNKSPNIRWTLDQQVMSQSGTQTVYTNESTILFQNKHHINGFPKFWLKSHVCGEWLSPEIMTSTKRYFVGVKHKVSRRSVQCEVELNEGSLEVGWLTKPLCQVTKQRAKTRNTIVLNFCTFSWFLSIHYWLFLIMKVRVILFECGRCRSVYYAGRKHTEVS